MKSRSVFIQSLPTSNTVLYTAPPNTRVRWVMAFLSNGTGSTISDVGITVEHVETSQTVPVIGSKSFSSGDFLLFGDGNYVMLDTGDQIKGIADDAGISVILTLEEITGLVKTA